MSKEEKEVFPSSNYSLLSERLRIKAPPELQCSLFCGGLQCKYERFEQWKCEQRELDVVYSNWIMDDVIAMSRPNSAIIQQLIDLFKKHKIKSIFNLQQLKEHSKCGRSLEESGFSYDPQVFMDNGIYYYNFQWKDYSIISQHFLLDIIKVLSFALKEGKVAIHCHAGLGRTGVLIASYLLYCKQINSPANAINFVRSKRPNSIQTRQQLETVFKFYQYLQSLVKCKSPTIELIVSKQRKLLHGLEYRQFKHIPKTIHIVVEKLKEQQKKETLASLMCRTDDDEDEPIEEKRSMITVAEALLREYRLFSKTFRSKLDEIKRETNENFFDNLLKEEDILIHSALLFKWFNDLKEPFFNKTAIITIILKEDPNEALMHFDSFRRNLFLYLIEFISTVIGKNEQYSDILLKRFIAEFCQQTIKLDDNKLIPRGVQWNQLRKGTFHTIYGFVSSFLLTNNDLKIERQVNQLSV